MRRYRASVALRLPKPGHLPTTGPGDAIEQYFGGVTGLLLRRRLAWVRALLPREPLDRILEIGYGSGVFQYELCRTARVSVGIDVHPRAPVVRRRLAEDDVPSLLVQGDGSRLPFADGCFDAVVPVSTLEFVPQPGRCLRESRRVLRPGGLLILLTPRELPLADHLWNRSLAATQQQTSRPGARTPKSPRPLAPAASLDTGADGNPTTWCCGSSER